MFFHIPIYEFINMYNNDEFYGNQGEEVCCSSINTGLFSVIKEHNICEWVIVGHDHNNDYYGLYEGVYLAFGRKTGYGQYGPDGFQRGARVYEITQEPYSIKHWVREADGNIHTESQPKRK